MVEKEEIVMSAVSVEQNSAFNQRLAILLKELRGSSSFREFAEKLGVLHSDVRRWELELKGEPKSRVLRKIAALRGWTVDELMAYLEGEVTSPPDFVSQLLDIVRGLPFETAAQVAKVAVETMAIKGDQAV
jgi:transcriptional regulator with XRE-family HTH domain